MFMLEENNLNAGSFGGKFYSSMCLLNDEKFGQHGKALKGVLTKSLFI
jgi:hypothetical protein